MPLPKSLLTKFHRFSLRRRSSLSLVRIVAAIVLIGLGGGVCMLGMVVLARGYCPPILLQIVSQSPSLPGTELTSPPGLNSPTLTLVIRNENTTVPLPIELAIADTAATRARGLMFRTDLKAAEGMLFIFPRAATQHFWMKNTPTSLDIIFLDQHKRVLNIAAHTTPNAISPTYQSHGEALYVVELKAGVAAQQGIHIGTQLDWLTHEAS